MNRRQKKKYAKKNNFAIAKGVLQVADEKNRNGRTYPKELFAQLRSPKTPLPYTFTEKFLL